MNGRRLSRLILTGMIDGAITTGTVVARAGVAPHGVLRVALLEQ